jgi:hypothetical protein
MELDISITGRIYALRSFFSLFFYSNTGFTVGARGRILKQQMDNSYLDRSSFTPANIDCQRFVGSPPRHSATATVGK